MSRGRLRTIIIVTVSDDDDDDDGNGDNDSHNTLLFMWPRNSVCIIFLFFYVTVVPYVEKVTNFQAGKTTSI